MPWSRSACAAGQQQRRARHGAWFAWFGWLLAAWFAGCDSSTFHPPSSRQTPGETDAPESVSVAASGSSAAALGGFDGNSNSSTPGASEMPGALSAPTATPSAPLADAEPALEGSSPVAGSAGQDVAPSDASAGPTAEQAAGASPPVPPADAGPEPAPLPDAGAEPAALPTGQAPLDATEDSADAGTEAPTEPSDDETSETTPPDDETSETTPPDDETSEAAPPDDETPETAPPDGATDVELVAPGSPAIPSGLGAFHLTVIGSSTAAGIGASRAELAWVSLLDTALAEQVTTRFSSSNLARGGYAATDLLPGSASPGSIDDAIAERPDLILIALAGSNDLAPSFTTEAFMAQLITLRETARAAGIPTFFMGTLPKNFSPAERATLLEWDRAMHSEFSSCWIPGPARPYAPCYMDVFASLADASLGLAPALDSGDGQHPNDAGHALLFQQVAPIVAPYVCSKTTCR